MKMDCKSLLKSIPVNKSFVTLILALLTFSAAKAQNELVPDLKIVAFVARNSPDRNQFKNKADWIELKYFGSSEFDLTELKLYITDKASSAPLKYELPNRKLKPGEVWRIWCDSENVYSNQVHTNFKLSKKGEDLALFYLLENGDLIKIDHWNYSRIPKNEIGKRKNESTITPILPIQD